ncbi:MAG: hypothetical protein QOG68_2654, partial [Solirubrobacteraceae bacterium]|nr:hypothetical protein [Solirubrobacteraceae bacterium]
GLWVPAGHAQRARELLAGELGLGA